MVRLSDYKGMNVHTGEWISGLDHLRQSVSQIITTTLGTRFMQPDFGCSLFSKIDAPQNGATIAEIIGDIALALELDEPRLTATFIKIFDISPGQITISMSGIDVEGNQISLDFNQGLL